LEDTSCALAEMELLGRVTRRETPDGGEPHWCQKRRE
jgi:hypothetical protein